jgi:cell wall-associated NlpC family hydrolase
MGQAVYSNVQPADRLYFCDSSYTRISHTGIYLGNGLFIHSASSRGGVAIDDVRNPKWRLIAIRRDFDASQPGQAR